MVLDNTPTVTPRIPDTATNNSVSINRSSSNTNSNNSSSGNTLDEDCI